MRGFTEKVTKAIYEVANIPTLGTCHLRNANSPIYTNMLLVKLLEERKSNLKNKTGPTFSKNKSFSHRHTLQHILICTHLFERDSSFHLPDCDSCEWEEGPTCLFGFSMGAQSTRSHYYPLSVRTSEVGHFCSPWERPRLGGRECWPKAVSVGHHSVSLP